MISLQRLKRMEYLSFMNGLRLHYDSIKMYNDKSFPTAYFLSIVAMEELGRSFFLMDITYYRWLENENGMSAKELNEVITLLYSHSHKQKTFRRWSLLEDFASRKKFKKIWEDTELLESKKQNAVYVGIPKTKGKIDLKKRINNPVTVSKKTARTIITEVSTALRDMIAGVIYGSYGLDDENIEAKINKKLYRKLKDIWPETMSHKTKRILELERKIKIL